MIVTSKELRGKLNLTQEAFAQKLGVSVMTIRRWEKGNNPTTPSRIAQKLLDTLSCELEPEKVVSYTKTKQIKG